MKLIVLVVVLAARLAGAQQNARPTTGLIKTTAAVLDSARKTSGVRLAVVDNASVIFAAAATQLRNGNYTGAQRLADVAIRLAHGALHGPMEIGARIDSIPFGAVAVGPGVPQSALSTYFGGVTGVGGVSGVAAIPGEPQSVLASY